LKKDKSVNINDCHSLQKHAKILYEQGKYKESEKILFSLKEILVNEQSSNADLMIEVFWGLLSCEILNGKGRDVVEHTSLQKMKNLLERRQAEESVSAQGHTQSMTWLLHWMLVYSFTSKENNGLFATILSDTEAYGTQFQRIVQMRSGSLSKYMISSFIMARG